MGKVVITFDVLTCAPEGPQKEFPRQLRGQIEAILNELNRIGVVTADLAGAQARSVPVGYFPRVKAGGDELPTTASPRLIDWSEAGSTFDDVGAAEATEFQLPNSSDYPDTAIKAPWFHFQNTSGQIMRIRAGDDDTIQADVADASAAGGALELESSNGNVMLVLYDDRWRAWDLRGEYGIVA